MEKDKLNRCYHCAELVDIYSSIVDYDNKRIYYLCLGCLSAMIVSSIADEYDLESYEGNYLAEGISHTITSEFSVPTKKKTQLEIMRARFNKSGIRKKVLERDAYRCQKCSSWKNLQVDHIKPLSKGGTNEADNLQVLCRPCNAKKGAKYDE